MKSRFWLLVLLCLLPSLVSAKNVQLKILIFADSNDNSIGGSVIADIQAYKQLATDIRSALEPSGVNTTLNVFSGNNCSYDKLDNYLDSFSCYGDIVFFIYNGHGARSHQDESKFPRMCLGSNYLDKWMKVSDLIERLRQKNPRLMVIATDCCNSYYDRAGLFDQSPYNATMDNRGGEGIRELFLSSSGEVCITGSSPGEYGWATGDGGLLSINFIKAIYKADKLGSSANWPDLLQEISDETYSNSAEYYNAGWISNTQRPVFDVDVKKSGFSDVVDDHDSDNNEVNNTDDGITDDNSNFDDDELYEDNDVEDDEESFNFGSALFGSFWVFLIGFLLVWVPKYLDLEGPIAFVLRMAGIGCFIWAIILFFSLI